MMCYSSSSAWRKRWTALGVSASALLLAAACSSSGKSGSGAGTTSATGGGSSTGASTGGSASSMQAAAEAAIAPYVKDPTSIGVTAPLTKSVKGKTVAYIQCNVPECVQQGDAMTSAAAVLGVKLLRIDAGQTPQSYAAAFSNAVQKKPDVVLSGGIDPVVVKTQLAALKAANIPVVEWDIPEASVNGLPNLLPQSANEHDGRLMADYALAKSPTTVHAVAFTATEFSIFGPQTAAFKAEVTSKCAKCSAEVVGVSIASVGTALPGRVVSYLQQHPETNVIDFAFGTLVTGVPEALKAAGVGQHALIISQAGGTPNWQYIRSGQQTVDLALDLNYYGWKMMDAGARAITGSPLTPDQNEPPIHFLTKDNLTFSGSDFVAIKDYKQQFTKLWASAQ